MTRREQQATQATQAENRSRTSKTSGNLDDDDDDDDGRPAPSTNLFYNLDNPTAYSAMDVHQLRLKNEIVSRHRPVRSRFKTNGIIATNLYTCLYADTIEYYKNDHAANSGAKYIMVVVDGLSHQAFVRPMYTKTSAETSRALEDIIKRLDLPGHTFFLTDQGNEFYGDVSRLLEKWGITPHKMTGPHKSSPAERFM
jgi:hypothetical protein